MQRLSDKKIVIIDGTTGLDLSAAKFAVFRFARSIVTHQARENHRSNTRAFELPESL